MSEWISVEDRIPKEIKNSNGTGFSKEVLILDCYGEMSIAWYVYPWRDERLLGFSDGVKNSFGVVTHWMPLPEPPK